MSSSGSRSSSESSSAKSGSESAQSGDYNDDYDESKGGSRSPSNASDASKQSEEGSESSRNQTASEASVSRRKSTALGTASEKSGESGGSGSRRSSATGEAVGSGSDGKSDGDRGKGKKDTTGSSHSSEPKGDSNHESSDGGGSRDSSDAPPRRRPQVQKHVVPHARGVDEASEAASEGKASTRPVNGAAQTRGAAYSEVDRQVTSVSTQEELSDLLLLNDQLRLKLETQRSILQKGRNSALGRTHNKMLWRQYRIPAAAASCQRLMTREGTRRELRREQMELMERHDFLQRKVNCVKQLQIYSKLIQECKNDIVELTKERRSLLLSIRSNEKLLISNSESGESEKMLKQLVDEVRANSVLAQRTLDHRRRDAVLAIRMRKEAQKRVEKLEEQVREAKGWEPPVDLDDGTRSLFEEYRWKSETICELHKQLARLKGKSRGESTDSSAVKAPQQSDKESRAFYVAKIKELKDEISRLTSVSGRRKGEHSPAHGPVEKAFSGTPIGTARSGKQKSDDASARKGANDSSPKDKSARSNVGDHDPLEDVKRRVDEARRSNTTSQVFDGEHPQDSGRTKSHSRRDSNGGITPRDDGYANAKGDVDTEGKSVGGSNDDSGGSEGNKRADGSGSDEYTSQKDEYGEDKSEPYSASEKRAGDDYSENNGNGSRGELEGRSPSESGSPSRSGTDARRESVSTGNSGSAPAENDEEGEGGGGGGDDGGADWLDF